MEQREAAGLLGHVVDVTGLVDVGDLTTILGANDVTAVMESMAETPFVTNSLTPLAPELAITKRCWAASCSFARSTSTDSP